LYVQKQTTELSAGDLRNIKQACARAHDISRPLNTLVTLAHYPGSLAMPAARSKDLNRLCTYLDMRMRRYLGEPLVALWVWHSDTMGRNPLAHFFAACDGLIQCRLGAGKNLMLKSALKKTALYRHYFALRNARLISEWSDEDQARLEFYKRLIRPEGLVFDVGANLGNRAKVFMRLGCRVIAVEPQRSYATALKKALGPSVTVVSSAVSAQIGKAELRGANNLATLSPDFIEQTRRSGRFATELWDERETVPTTTLGALITRFGVPDFIKIDVEGHEASVLRGLSTPVRSLSFEFHPETLVGTMSCIDTLDRLARYRYNFSYGETLVFHFPSWIGSEEMGAFLAEERSRRGDVYARRA
jgi:FkbM family methyltransferase